MEKVSIKSANQMWKESRTTLSFKDWIQREKEKYFNADAQGDDVKIILNKPLTDSINKAIDNLNIKAGMKYPEKDNKTLGISNWVLIGGALLIVGAVAYTIYKKKKE